MTNDEKAVKQAEGGGRHGKKVRRSDGLPVIAKKRQPALPAIANPRNTPHPAGDATPRDVEPEHHEFSVNLGSTPSGVLGYDFEDEFADVFGHRLLPIGFCTREISRQ
jgi:hypothetical protein